MRRPGPIRRPRSNSARGRGRRGRARRRHPDRPARADRFLEAAEIGWRRRRGRHRGMGSTASSGAPAAMAGTLRRAGDGLRHRIGGHGVRRGDRGDLGQRFGLRRLGQRRGGLAGCRGADAASSAARTRVSSVSICRRRISARSSRRFASPERMKATMVRMGRAGRRRHRTEWRSRNPSAAARRSAWRPRIAAPAEGFGLSWFRACGVRCGKCDRRTLPIP